MCEWMYQASAVTKHYSCCQISEQVLNYVVYPVPYVKIALVLTVVFNVTAYLGSCERKSNQQPVGHVNVHDQVSIACMCLCAIYSSGSN